MMASSSSSSKEDSNENRIRDVQRKVEFLKAELKDSEARYACWKNVLTEECKDNEKHFQSKLNAAHSKFDAIVDELKESVNLCRNESSETQAANERLIANQADLIETATQAQSKKIDVLRDEFNKGIKEQTRKFSKESASVAQAFLSRMNEQREAVESAIQKSQNHCEQSMEKHTKEASADLRAELSQQKESISSTFEKKLSQQKETFEGSIEGGLAVLKDTMTQLFREEVAKQRVETEENFLQGIDKMERWLKGENSRREAEMKEIRQVLSDQGRELKAAEEWRFEAKRQMQDFVVSETSRIEESLETERQRISTLTETTEEKFGQADAATVVMKEEIMVNSSKMVKDCLMLNVQLKALENRSSKHMAVYETALEECNRTKDDMQQSFDNQNNVFQSYEDKILQHSSDFQAYLDEHSSKTEDIQTRLQDLNDDFDRLHDKVLDNEGKIEATNSSLNQMSQDRAADNAHVAKMGKTWESLYAHLAAELQDTVEAHAVSRSLQEDSEKAREVNLKATVEELQSQLGAVKTDVSESRSFSFGLKTEIENTDTKLKSLADSVSDFARKEGLFNELNTKVNEIATELEESRSENRNLSLGLKTEIVNTEKQVKSLSDSLVDFATKDDLFSAMDIKVKEISAVLGEVRSSLADMIVRTDRVESSGNSQGAEIRELQERIRVVAQDTLATLSKKIDAHVEDLATLGKEMTTGQKAQEDQVGVLSQRISDVSNDLQKRSLQTAVDTRLATLEQNLTTRADKMNQALEKNRGQSENLRRDVDKCVIKVDVLQSNLGSININLFNDLQKRVADQTKQLLMDKQERSFAHSKIMDIEETIDGRIKAYVHGEEYTASQDEMRELVDGTDKRLSRHLAILKQDVESIASDSSRANQRLNEYDETLANLSKQTDSTYTLVKELDSRFAVENSSTERQFKVVDKELILLASKIEQNIQDVLGGLQKDLASFASCDFVGETVEAAVLKTEGRMKAMKNQLAHSSSIIKQLQLGVSSNDKGLETLRENMSTIDKEFGVMLTSQIESRSDIQTISKSQMDARIEIGDFASSYEQQLKELRNVIATIGTELMSEVTKHVLVQNQTIKSESEALKENAAKLNIDINGQLEAIKTQVKGCFRSSETKMRDELDSIENEFATKLHRLAVTSDEQETKVSLLKDDVDMISTNIADIQATIEPAVATLSAKLENQSCEINAAREEIAEFNSTVDELSSRVVVMEDKNREFCDRATDIDSKIAEQRGEIHSKCEALEGSLKLYVDNDVEVAVAELSEKVNQTNEVIETLNQRVDESFASTNLAVDQVNDSLVKATDQFDQKLVAQNDVTNSLHESVLSDIETTIKPALVTLTAKLENQSCEINAARDEIAEVNSSVDELSSRVVVMEDSSREICDRATDIDSKFAEQRDEIHSKCEALEGSLKLYVDNGMEIAMAELSEKAKQTNEVIETLNQSVDESFASTNLAVAQVNDSLTKATDQFNQKLVAHDDVMSSFHGSVLSDIETTIKPALATLSAKMETQSCDRNGARDDIAEVICSVDDLRSRVVVIEDKHREVSDHTAAVGSKIAEQRDEIYAKCETLEGSMRLYVDNGVEVALVTMSDKAKKTNEEIGELHQKVDHYLSSTNVAVEKAKDSFVEATKQISDKLALHDEAIDSFHRAAVDEVSKHQAINAQFKAIEQENATIIASQSQNTTDILAIKGQVIEAIEKRIEAVEEVCSTLQERKDAVQRSLDTNLSHTASSFEIKQELEKVLMEHEEAIKSLNNTLESTTVSRKEVYDRFQAIDDTAKGIAEKQAEVEERFDVVQATVSIIQDVQCKLDKLEGCTREFASEEEQAARRSSEKISLLESAVTALQTAHESLVTTAAESNVDFKVSEHESIIQNLASSIEDCRTTQQECVRLINTLEANGVDGEQLKMVDTLFRTQQNSVIEIESKLKVMEESQSQIHESNTKTLEENIKKHVTRLQEEMTSKTSSLDQRVISVEESVKEITVAVENNSHVSATQAKEIFECREKMEEAQRCAAANAFELTNGVDSLQRSLANVEEKLESAARSTEQDIIETKSMVENVAETLKKSVAELGDQMNAKTFEERESVATLVSESREELKNLVQKAAVRSTAEASILKKCIGMDICNAQADFSCQLAALEEQSSTDTKALRKCVANVETAVQQKSEILGELQSRFESIEVAVSQSASKLDGLHIAVDSSTATSATLQSRLETAESQAEHQSKQMASLEERLVEGNNALDQRIGALDVAVVDQKTNLDAMQLQLESTVTELSEKIILVDTQACETKDMLSGRMDSIEADGKSGLAETRCLIDSSLETARGAAVGQQLSTETRALEKRVADVETAVQTKSELLNELQSRFESVAVNISQSASKVDGLRTAVDSNIATTTAFQSHLETVESKAERQSRQMAALEEKLVEENNALDQHIGALDVAVLDQKTNMNLMHQQLESKTTTLSEKVELVDTQARETKQMLSGRIDSVEADGKSGLAEVRCLIDSSVETALGAQEQVKTMRLTSLEETRKLNFLVNDLHERSKGSVDALHRRIGEFEQSLARPPNSISDAFEVQTLSRLAPTVDTTAVMDTTTGSVVAEEDAQAEPDSDDIEIIATCSSVEEGLGFSRTSSLTILVGGGELNQSSDAIEIASDDCPIVEPEEVGTGTDDVTSEEQDEQRFDEEELSAEVAAEKSKKKVTIKTPTYKHKSKKRAEKARRGNFRNALKALCDDLKSDVLPHLSEERDTTDTCTLTPVEPRES